MAKKVVQSGSLMSKLGAALAQSYETHKNDETEFDSGGNLPAGVELGVAELVECKFDTYKTGKLQGKFYFYAAGIVKEPKEHVLETGRTVRIEGLRTSIMEPLCDTPDSKGKKTTLDDHLASILNELRKLGVDTNSVGPADLETVAAALVGSGVHFGFRTWAGKPTEEFPTPRVSHTWTGACEYVESEGSADDVVESAPVVTAAPVASKPAAVAAKKAPVAATTPAVAAAPKVAAKKAPVKPAPAVDLDSLSADDLAAMAKGGNQDALLKLVSIAESLGFTEAQLEATANWQEVADMVNASATTNQEDDTATVDPVVLGQAADGGDAAAAESLTQLAVLSGLDPNDGESYPNWEALGMALSGESPEVVDVVPALKEVFKYTPPGKTKAVDCEVTAVFPANRTVNLKNLDDMKPLKGVSWDSLGR